MSEGPIVARRTGVILATPDESVETCLDRMTGADVGSILMIEDGRPTGILTERDLLRKWRQLLGPNMTSPLRAVATQPVFCLKLDGILYAPREMLARRIRHIPLIDDDGRVVGIMSMRDILTAQLRAGTLPRLDAVAPAATAGLPQCTMHVLAPTSQLAQVCKQFLPANWTCRIWAAPEGFADLTAADAKALRQMAFMLDLDGLPQDGWRPIVRRCIQLLTRSERPAIFLVSSPGKFAERDLASLRAIAEKGHWHAYARPLPVSALADDLAELNTLLGLQADH